MSFSLRVDSRLNSLNTTDFQKVPLISLPQAEVVPVGGIGYDTGTNTLGFEWTRVDPCRASGCNPTTQRAYHPNRWGPRAPRIPGQKGDSVIGQRGAQGEPGRPGIDGRAGESIVGPRGPQGAQGQPGHDGISVAGDKGPQGDPGKPGKDGESIVGPQGPQGVHGEKATVFAVLEALKEKEEKVSKVHKVTEEPMGGRESVAQMEGSVLRVRRARTG